MGAKLSKSKAVELIVNELQKGTAKPDILSKFVKLCQKDKRTIERYYKTAEQSHSSKAQMIEKEVTEVLVRETVNQAKMGLKLKFDRQIEIQVEIDDLLTRLRSGKTKDVYFKSGKPITYERNLTPNEISNFKKTLLLLNAELSKMAGDYAPTRSELSGKDGKPIEVDSPIPVFNFNNISTEEILKILKLNESK